MKPRVFVSSTYYDLKYLRERIELFLERFNFEPVLFESDKLTYEHGRPLDSAAYEEVKHCHMMVLIVGGRYGTSSIDIETLKEWRKRYDDEFVSITRNEYETAVKQNIPVFIFIDKNVYAEYNSFKENEDFFRKLISDGKIEDGTYKFSHVDNHNVFYFIDSLSHKAIKTFEKVDEVEAYLNNQFSGMFFLYLKQLQDKSSNQKILDTINELNSVVNRMDAMVAGIGKEVIKDPAELEEINHKQFEVIAELFTSTLIDNGLIEFEDKDTTLSKDDAEEVVEAMWKYIFSIEIEDQLLRYISSKKYPEEYNAAKSDREKLLNRIILNFNAEISLTVNDFQLKNIDIERLYYSFRREVKPFIVDDTNIQAFKKALYTLIYFTY